ncbi:MAG: C45 family autoproteolytic acyltransferase/hydrolase, partial [Candidatus Hydrogenedentes bacterium]|nr:C45 family autoproteolytic acyltransferase/hydrolase [Candidatus Hydrogenedentota bacterium]
LLVLAGTPYEMGHRYAELMEPTGDIKSFLPLFLASAQVQDPVKFSTVNLDAAWNKAAPYMEARVVDEMNGMAEGLAVTGTGHAADVTRWFNLLRRVHMIPSLQSYSCSSVAAWKDATSSGDVLQARDLDWTLIAHLQDYPCIVVYLPENGSPHVNVTSAGMIGVHTGFNLAGISLAEIGVATPEPYDLRGESFMSFSRTILYDAKNLDSAADIIKTARRIKNYDYVIADGRWQRAAAKI